MRCSAQGVGKRYLCGVAYLVQRERHNNAQCYSQYGLVRGEQAHYKACAGQEHYTYQRGAYQHDVISAPCYASYCRGVAVALGVAQRYGHCGADTVVQAETEHAACGEYLECRQRYGAKPACYNSRSGERCRLEGHLHRHREARARNQTRISFGGGTPAETVPVWFAETETEEYQRHSNCREHSRYQCADSCPCKPKFRKAEVTVYQRVVTQNVKGVAAQHNPCGYSGIVYRIAPLGEYIEHHHRNQSGENYQVVWAYQRHKLGRLPELVQHEIACEHQRRYNYSENRTYPKPGACYRANPVAVATSENGTEQRRKAVGEARAAENGDVEEIVYERCGCKRLGGIISHHYIVGERQGYGAQLSDEQRQSQTSYVAVVS